jgi:hypothetical protein
MHLQATYRELTSRKAVNFCLSLTCLAPGPNISAQ